MQAKQRGVYPEDWKDIAMKLKEDAGWRCVRCLHPHDVPSGHVLTVHHFDGDRNNNARHNLMVLCQRCHLSVQARVDPDVGWLGPYSAWSFPYIAGFFASGKGTPPPGYSVYEWWREYQWAVGPWPEWAVQP